MIYLKKPKEFTPKFKVVSCTIEYLNSFLLLQTGKQKSMRNKWGVPAGKLESEEKLIDGIIREVYEETGIEVQSKDIAYFDKVYVTHDGYSFIYYMYTYRVSQKPTIQLTPEHQDFKWVTAEEALALDLIPDEDFCIKMYFKR
jgi:8-oxo-dGTP diphosphatase